MAGTITHEWNGTVLIITSDSGTSSMNLKGDTGMRGVQGRAGIILNADGTINMNGYATEEYVDGKIAQIEGTDLTDYATKSYVNNAISKIEPEDIDLSNYYTKPEVDAALEDVDLTGYATETFVTTKIAAAQLEGAGVDMSGYVTQDDLDEAVANAGVGKEGTQLGSEVFNDYRVNVSSGMYSHAEGTETTASGHYGSHAEGWGTTASNQAAHAEGRYTTASGYGAHAEGRYTVASGSDSHAEGLYTIASGDYQHVSGVANIEDKGDKYAVIVGNGITGADSNYNTVVRSRSNAYTLDWDGNAWFAGNVYVGGTSMEDAVMLGSGSGGSVNLSNYYTKAQVEDLINDAITNLPVYQGEVV